MILGESKGKEKHRSPETSRGFQITLIEDSLLKEILKVSPLASRSICDVDLAGVFSHSALSDSHSMRETVKPIKAASLNVRNFEITRSPRLTNEKREQSQAKHHFYCRIRIVEEREVTCKRGSTTHAITDKEDHNGC